MDGGYGYRLAMGVGWVGGFEVVSAGVGVSMDLPAVVVDLVVAVVAYQCEVVEVSGSVL